MRIDARLWCDISHIMSQKALPGPIKCSILHVLKLHKPAYRERSSASSHEDFHMNLAATIDRAEPAAVNYETHPERYRHWKLSFSGPVATLSMDVAEDGGIRP